ncbi:MAG: sulfatase-like hydrolase/transferase [Alphaproteobacteria bacterium]|nr:sulfatase-like hydrolase/transferase [Alphaproteobacteria bacterium]
MTGNLLILVADEFARSCLGCAGHPVIQSPHLDALAARGTRFTRAYCNSPICVPARAVIQTGRYVHQSGHWDSAHPYRGKPEGWAHALRHRDVDAVSVGKLHFGSSRDDNGFSPEILPLHVADGVGWMPALLRDPLPDFPAARELAAEVGPGETEYHRYDRDVRDAACSWLDHRGRENPRPWALFVSFASPHYPLVAPHRFFDLYRDRELGEPIPSGGQDATHPVLRKLIGFFDYDRHFTAERRRLARASYFALISFVDELIGDVLSALGDSGFADDTTVLFLSDHGEMLGDLGIWTKQVMYEGSVGIPLILAGPGTPGGHVSHTPVSLIDIYPTTFDAVLGEVPETELPGQSLISLAGAADDHDRVVFSEYHDGGSPTGMFMVRKGHWKLVHYAGARPQLFNLDTDRDELRDLADDPGTASTLAEMERTLCGICDPAEVNARAFADQAALIAEYGGEQALRRRSDLSFNYTPVPAA